MRQPAASERSSFRANTSRCPEAAPERGMVFFPKARGLHVRWQPAVPQILGADSRVLDELFDTVGMRL
jgi:hypothetical protein